MLYSQIPYIFLECLAKFLVCEFLTSNIESRLTLLNFFPTDIDHSFFILLILYVYLRLDELMLPASSSRLYPEQLAGWGLLLRDSIFIL